MKPIPLHHVWQYTDVDREFWARRLEDWLPPNIIDAHMHVSDPALRLAPMTDEMRRQYWVNEVLEPMDFTTADHCYAVLFPGRRLTCVGFGMPDLDFDLEAGNAYAQQGCHNRGWHNLAVVRPQWSAEYVSQWLDQPGVVGVKPYYALISRNRETRDAHLEAGIFDFLPHHQLEVLNERRAWVTLHVPKADRLGHPDNLRDIRELRRRYPRVILVIAHLGRCYTEIHAREALPPLADDPGLFFDTSAVLNPASYRIALEHIGPSRLLFGSDNPILFMRGRRQFHQRQYVNRTNYPFHFNRDREPPEIEALYTLFLYEDLWAMRQACQSLGMDDPRTAAMIFHDNAQRLLQLMSESKQKAPP
ncbi:MAG TPA: amidohydrolase family protein [Candidatus Paceibacterota bacterium]|nr:amidohydrolase family protein [Candidatus Paceibacterota bacterium]